MDSEAKILLVDDHKVFLDGVTSILRNSYEIKNENTVEKALKVYSYYKPNLIITDLQIPEKDGIYLIKEIRKVDEEVKILVLSSTTNPVIIHKLLNLKVNGFLNKNVSSFELLNAVSKILAGDNFYQEDFYKNYIQDYKKRIEDEDTITPRELEVLKLIIAENTTQEIADILNISTFTVDGYRKNLLVKTGSTNIVGLMKYAIKINLM